MLLPKNALSRNSSGAPRHPEVHGLRWAGQVASATASAGHIKAAVRCSGSR
jgi:hypothetical protein